MEFGQKAITLEENAIITKDYNEEIIVPKNKTLVIDGFTNRLITNLGGTVIVNGTCLRINNIGGTVIINDNGYVNSLFGMCASCENKINGFVCELILRDNTKNTLNTNSMVKSVCNQDSSITMLGHAHIDHYVQHGNLATISIDKDSVILNREIKKGLFY